MRYQETCLNYIRRTIPCTNSTTPSLTVPRPPPDLDSTNTLLSFPLHANPPHRISNFLILQSIKLPCTPHLYRSHALTPRPPLPRNQRPHTPKNPPTRHSIQQRPQRRQASRDQITAWLKLDPDE